MNLVAKEFVAAQDREDPGVLLLSKFAGAAEHLTLALLTNPYHPDGLAADLDTALRMPREERDHPQRRAARDRVARHGGARGRSDSSTSCAANAAATSSPS